MRMGIRVSVFAGILALMAFVGCQAYKAPPNPNEPVGTSLQGAKSDVGDVVTDLDTNPPKVSDAKVKAVSAGKHIDSAISQNQDAKDGYDKLAQHDEDQTKEVAKLNAQFFSPRQRHLFFFILFGIGILGILAAIGEFYPGWWSYPALWAIKAARFVIFGGIPHIVKAIVAAFKFIKGKLAKTPAPAAA